MSARVLQVRLITLETSVAILLFFSLVILGFSGPFIENLGIEHLIFSAFFLVSCVAGLPLLFVRSVTATDFWLFAGFVYLVLAIFLSKLLGNSFPAIIRSTIPFIFLPVTYFVVSSLTMKLRKRLLLAIFVFGVFVAFSGLGKIFWNWLNGAGFMRLTAVSDNSHVPVLLISLAIIPCVVRSKRSVLFFTALLLVAILATQSKGQVLVAGLIIGKWVFDRDGGIFGLMDKRWRIVLAGIPLIVLFGFAIVLDLSVLNRFQAASALGETTFQRIEELKQAWDAFLSSPWIGDGAGRTFFVNSPVTGYLERQRYIHNLPAYLLATGGILGVMAYSFMLFPLFPKGRDSQGSIERGPVRLAIVAALLYCVVSATFKSIHLNVFLGVLLACLAPVAISRSQTK